MKKTRKLLAILLVACLIASFAPMSFADDPPAPAEGDPAPAAEGGEATVTITQDGEKTTMVAESEGPTVVVDTPEAPGSLESVNVDISFDESSTEGKIIASTSDNNTYASVQSSGDMQLDIKVEGDVGTAETAETPASGNGITLKNFGFSDGEGASAATTEVSIYADGNVNSVASSGGMLGPTANGIEAKSEVVYNSKDTIISNVTAEGNVSASAGDPEDIYFVNGVNASAVNSGTGSAVTNVVVNGDNGITAVGGEKARGINAVADSDGAGSTEVNVTVNGIDGVIAEADNGVAYGISAIAHHIEEDDNSETDELEEVEDNAQCKVTVKVANGGVTVTGNSAFGVDGNISGSAEFFVNQNVDVLSKGDGEKATGIQINAYGENTEVKLDVGGVVASETGKNGAAFGALLTARDGALLNAAIGNNGITAAGSNATGIYTLASGKGTEVNVADEGITAESNANNVAHGVILYAQDKAAVTATIGQGGIFADGGAEIESGASLASTDGAFVSLDVAGDVTSNNGNGIVLGTEPSSDQAEETAPGSIDVFVEGSVYGKQNSILLNDSSLTSENVAITVWSTSYNTDGQIVGIRETDNEEEKAALNAAAGDIESNIRYIIKIGDSGQEYDNLEIGGAAVKDDSTHGYYVARAYDETEATIVSLKAVEGYQLVGVVHDDKDQTVRQDIIVQDTDGNYLLLIPHGGGLWISVSLEKIPEPSDDSSSYEFVLMALGRIIANDGSVLTIYNNRTYTLAYADGSNDNGTWKVADSLLVFTSSAGEEIAPERNADGDAVYTFKAGTEFVITSDIVNAVQSYRLF